jgi:electron transport complex protein RnfC
MTSQIEQKYVLSGGVKLDGRKNLSCYSPIVPANIPRYLVLPLLQHIGVPTEPVVSVGDKVLKGQVIADCHANDCHLQMSAPIHASSSGTVVAIEARAVPHPSGLMAPCIVIETDGQDTWVKLSGIADHSALSSLKLREHIAKAGIVGLGGAGFPSHLKLTEGIETLIINGAECEPYITCDDRLMQEHPSEIIQGALILQHTLGGAKRCIIAVEDNKPAAYTALQGAAAGEEIEVISVPTRYPIGGERQLIYTLTGKEIGRAKIPANIGILVHNVETTRAIYRAVQQGRPLISRVLTVTGGGVANPQNLEVLLGTPMHAVIEQCGRQAKIERLIMGGAMMGLSLANDEMPIVKTTNCLIAAKPGELANRVPSMPCIRCGACAQVCPINLLPQQLYWYTRAKDFKKAQEYHLFDCIDCGCCAYVCPSHIPLVDYYRYAKAAIRAKGQERQQAERARQRHEFRQARLARERLEKAARHQQATTF